MPKTKEWSPWIDKNLQKLIKRRNRAFQASKKTGKHYYEQKFLGLKRKVQLELSRAYWKHTEDIVSPSEKDVNNFSCMKRFWRFIKHQKKDYTSITTLKVNGKLIIDPKQKADALNSQFKSVFAEETDFQIPSKRLAPEWQIL